MNVFRSGLNSFKAACPNLYRHNRNIRKSFFGKRKSLIRNTFGCLAVPIAVALNTIFFDCPGKAVANLSKWAFTHKTAENRDDADKEASSIAGNVFGPQNQDASTMDQGPQSLTKEGPVSIQVEAKAAEVTEVDSMTTNILLKDPFVFSGGSLTIRNRKANEAARILAKNEKLTEIYLSKMESILKEATPEGFYSNFEAPSSKTKAQNEQAEKAVRHFTSELVRLINATPKTEIHPASLRSLLTIRMAEATTQLMERGRAARESKSQLPPTD